MKKQLFLLTLFAALCLTTGVACCQQAGAGPPAQPMFCRGGGAGAISGDGQHLYVAVGGKVLEYKLEGMTLEHSVDSEFFRASCRQGRGDGPMSLFDNAHSTSGRTLGWRRKALRIGGAGYLCVQDARTDARKADNAARAKTAHPP